MLAIKLHEDDPAPLLFVQEKLGGRFMGPTPGRRRYYFWRLMGKSLQASLPLSQSDFRVPEKSGNSRNGLEIRLAEILAIMSELERNGRLIYGSTVFGAR